MKTAVKALFAAGMAIALSVPASAQSIQFNGMGAEVQNAQFSLSFGTSGPRAGFWRDGGSYFYNGYRGYRERRDGYRLYRGFWFPLSAFSVNIDLGNERRSERRGRSADSAHVAYCYDRYRSYRESDNTFQPYNGPRRQCRSPY